jgi:hypothetical protein
MANEITVSMSLAFTKGDKNEKFKVSAATFDMAGTDYVKGTMITAAAPGTVIPLGGVTLAGWYLFKNNSTVAAEIISIKDLTGGARTINLHAGESSVGRFSTDTITVVPWAVAASGTPELEYMIIED